MEEDAILDTTPLKSVYVSNKNGLDQRPQNQFCTLLAELFDFSNHSQLTILSALAELDPVALLRLIQYLSRSSKHKCNCKMLNNNKYIVEFTVEEARNLNLYHEKGKDSEMD